VAGDFTPWLIGLDKGAKVMVKGRCPISRDMLSDWARPGEGLRPLDNDNASWLLRVIRRQYGGSIWTLISFYDSGREFQGSRPHAFIGAGVLARNSVVPGAVLQSLRTMIYVWQREIDQGGSNVEATAAQVWPNDEVQAELRGINNTLRTDARNVGLQPGKGNHFFRVLESDLPSIERSITGIQTGDIFFAESVLFSSSPELERRAKDLGFRTSPAENFAQWRAEQTVAFPEVRDRSTSSLSFGESTERTQIGDVQGEQVKTTSGLAFSSGESSDDGMLSANSSAGTTASPHSDEINSLRSAVRDAHEHIENIVISGEAASIALGNLSQLLDEFERKTNKPVKSPLQNPQRLHTHYAAYIVATVVIAALLLIYLLIFDLGRHTDSDDNGSGEITTQQVPKPPSPTTETPSDFVSRYYRLLKDNPDQALALREIQPQSNAGLRITDARLHNFSSYDVTALSGSEIVTNQDKLTSTVTGSIVATTESGTQLTGTVQVTLEADVPRSGDAPQWHIKLLNESPIDIRL